MAKTYPYDFNRKFFDDCPVCGQKTLIYELKHIRNPIVPCENCGLVNIEEKRKATIQEAIEYQAKN